MDVAEFLRRHARRIQSPVTDLPQLFNVATYFVDRNILEGRGENVAIQYGEERVTYQQLFERTNRA
jgi:acyl-coenzyme A synthetase/AMP-(fatty) acid ligase